MDERVRKMEEAATCYVCMVTKMRPFFSKTQCNRHNQSKCSECVGAIPGKKVPNIPTQDASIDRGIRTRGQQRASSDGYNVISTGSFFNKF